MRSSGSTRPLARSWPTGQSASSTTSSSASTETRSPRGAGTFRSRSTSWDPSGVSWSRTCSPTATFGQSSCSAASCGSRPPAGRPGTTSGRTSSRASTRPSKMIAALRSSITAARRSMESRSNVQCGTCRASPSGSTASTQQARRTADLPARRMNFLEGPAKLLAPPRSRILTRNPLAKIIA